MLRRWPDLPRYMKGGLGNPLGARSLYLGSSVCRIHGSRTSRYPSAMPSAPASSAWPLPTSAHLPAALRSEPKSSYRADRRRECDTVAHGLLRGDKIDDRLVRGSAGLPGCADYKSSSGKHSSTSKK